MPECVEVKINADLIKPLVVNHRINQIKLGSTSRYALEYPVGYSKFNDFLKSNDVQIEDIQTSGKFMYWTLSHDWYLFLTFGMTGQLSPTPGKHVCFELILNNKSIYFNDPRHFGTLKLTHNENDLLDKLNDLGWDPLQTDLNKYIPWLVNKLSKINKPIAQVLMDQSIFNGVGNYIKCESLYAAQISPWTIAKNLSKEDITKLCNCIVQVVNESYAHQGATIQTYKTPYGEEGRYSSIFKVYGKKIDPLGNPIISEDAPDKRTTHWCPNIQK